MLTIVFDTNSIYKHPWLTTLEQGREVLALAEKGICQVVIPQVVKEELHRQQLDAANSSYCKALKGLAAMTDAGIDTSEVESQLEEIHQRVVSDIEDAFDTLFKRDGVNCEPIPDISVEKLVQRDLARRRPFEEIDHQHKKKSVGFRDALIWESVLAVLSRGVGDERVFFVSSDHGFLSNETHGFHPHLLEDLDEHKIDRGRLSSAKNLFVAVTALKAEADVIAKSTAVTEALYELVGEAVDMRLAPGGDYEYPDFVEFTVPGIESPTITYMEQITELKFSVEGTSVTAWSDWDIYLEGALFKSDWYADDDDSVHVGSELNNHYFEASTIVTVLAEVELDLSDGDPTVTSVKLHDAREQEEG